MTGPDKMGFGYLIIVLLAIIAAIWGAVVKDWNVFVVSSMVAVFFFLAGILSNAPPPNRR